MAGTTITKVVTSCEEIPALRAARVLAHGRVVPRVLWGAGTAQQEDNKSSAEARSTTEGTGSMSGMNASSGETSPAMLVSQDGSYSDERFIDMMVLHHQMAIDMADIAQQKGEHPKITQLAGDIMSAQQKEIEELKDIRERDYGSSDTPTQLNPEEMETWA
jgi:uncharacterized protein (DUF305 family)